MAAKSDGVLKMKKSDVAFTPLQNSDHSGSVQGLAPGSQPDSGTGEADFANGESRCCGSNSTCLRLGREQQKYTVWDCLWILAAVAVYFADVGTDIWLSVDYCLRGEYWWFGLTLFFVVLGSFSVQVFSFRWFVHDFSTEDSSAGDAAGCSHMDGKLLSCSASHGDVGAHPSTPQRQASTASKSNTTTNSSNSSTAARTNKKPSASCSFCIWLLQSIIHILQLGQIWRKTLYIGTGRSARWRLASSNYNEGTNKAQLGHFPWDPNGGYSMTEEESERGCTPPPRACSCLRIHPPFSMTGPPPLKELSPRPAPGDWLWEWLPYAIANKCKRGVHLWRPPVAWGRQGFRGGVRDRVQYLWAQPLATSSIRSVQAPGPVRLLRPWSETSTPVAPAASPFRSRPQREQRELPGYFHTIYLGIRSRQSGENDRWRFYWRMVYEYADVSMLHLLATFLESAPQLVLQLCIIIQTLKLQAVQAATRALRPVALGAPGRRRTAFEVFESPASIAESTPRSAMSRQEEKRVTLGHRRLTRGRDVIARALTERLEKPDPGPSSPDAGSSGFLVQTGRKTDVQLSELSSSVSGPDGARGPIFLEGLGTVGCDKPRSTPQDKQGMTAAASLVSLAWALASYQKALRDSRDDKKPVSYLAIIIQFCWHFFTIAARVVTFALFASVFELYFGIFIVLHWCIMTFWIVHCETEFCVTKWEEIVFDMVVGVIYIFSWFNVKEGRTRCRLLVYYAVILLENTTLSALWYLYRVPAATDAFAVPALGVIFSSFLTGVVFMLMYYTFFHPNGTRFGRSASLARLDEGVGGGAGGFGSPPPGEGATNSLRSNRGGGGTLARDAERDGKCTERDGCAPPVFQVRPTAPSTPSSRVPRLEETVIKIDVCRNRYPAWERHVLDRSIRRAILAIDTSPTPPRLQYKDDALVHERLEYETTL
ncbi:hypothetical protein P4O66_014084 [Electrophorus voltai]|uniref:XK-related protein n=1 Tax=Electrophorus voltai TaxID=2609070 RepID=A0AAD8Z039_9TELE|nr:hypothetical protein P4O66_014084 [Electrophorus voltai]